MRVEVRMEVEGVPEEDLVALRDNLRHAARHWHLARFSMTEEPEQVFRTEDGKVVRSE